MPGSVGTTLLCSLQNARHAPAHQDESASIFRDERLCEKTFQQSMLSS